MIDFRFDPFRFQYRAANKTGEVKTVAFFSAFGRYGFFLNETPVRLQTQPVSIICGGDTLSEVGRSAVPDVDNFRVDYGNVNNAASTGFVEIHSSRVGQVATINYRAIGVNLNASFRGDAKANLQRSAIVNGAATVAGTLDATALNSVGNVALATGGGATISASGKRLQNATATNATDAATLESVAAVSPVRGALLRERLRWALRPVDGDAPGSGVAYNDTDNVFIGITNGLNPVQRSTDGGFTWVNVTGTGVFSVRDVIYGGGVFIAYDETDFFPIYRTANNGTTWTTPTLPGPTGGSLRAAYGNGVFLFTTTLGRIYRSTDGGATWNVTTGHGAVSAVFYGNGRFILITDEAGFGVRVRYSTDGASWTNAPTPFPVSGANAGAYGNGVWIVSGFAVSGTSQSQVCRSTDNGLTWTAETVFPNASATSGAYFVLYSDGIFVVGFDALTSPQRGGYSVSYDDGLTWQTIWHSSVYSRRAAAGNGLFIFGGLRSQPVPLPVADNLPVLS
ncbi:MAG: exo-alpha-sialidase [Desulfurellales bacterium]|nr:MAG: exo-alpha-sialidase [Desulfurellales bacterium]